MGVHLTGRLSGQVLVSADADALPGIRERLVDGGVDLEERDGALAVPVDGEPAEVAELLQRLHALTEGPWTGPGA